MTNTGEAAAREDKNANEFSAELSVKKAAVLGAGTMGAGIAAHLANAGIPTLLLDIAPRELTPDEETKGLDAGIAEGAEPHRQLTFRGREKAKAGAVHARQTTRS